MGYSQRYLAGSGTEQDPFLVHSYEEWVAIDARYTVDVDPPYYKLMDDINMSAKGGYLLAKDFYYGHLNMNDHSIISPRIAVDKFLIADCDIYSNELEVIKPTGKVVTKGGCGQFLDVRGHSLKCIFSNCTFKRMLIDVNTDGMFLGESSYEALFDMVQAEQSHFVITNVGYMDKLFTSLYAGEEYPFIDCLFEFNGEAFDGPLIDFGYTSPDPMDKMLNRCMVAGKIDCQYLSYAYASCPYTIVNGTIRDCVFCLRGSEDPNEKGYGGYASRITQDKMTIGLRREDSGLYVKNQLGIDYVSDQDMRNPVFLKAIGFDVKNLNEE
jgi:hypothetical protein